jgi:endonuclease-8
MPEGPEIRRAADQLRRALGGFAIKSVELHHPNLREKDFFLGHRVLEVTTRGKAMLIRLSSGYTLYSHNQLYGRWTVEPVESAPEYTRTLRLSISTGKMIARLWSATEIEILPTAKENEHNFLSRLGPDVLDRNTTHTEIQARLLSRACQNKKAASLMLDQSAFAGLGNYLRSEILFYAGVHPDCHPVDLTSPKVKKWARAIKTVSKRAYLTGGITVSAKEMQKGKRSGMPKSQWRHWVFNREGQPCPRCATCIERKRYGGRRLDFCPNCQPL